MGKRRKLEQNIRFPKELQVNCRDPMCLGISYLGSETVMCFFCEEQWPAEDYHAHQAANDASDAYLDANGVPIPTKRCPKCNVTIEKNGGCDHMTCALCKYEWFWSPGLPYRTATVRYA